MHGVADVFAAGDITSFTVKQGGIAAQQADVAAAAIAAAAGASVTPQRFQPVLRGLLLTGREPRYLRREVKAQPEHPPVASYEPLWWPPAKIVGRHLAPFLASQVGAAEADPERADESLSVEVPLEPDFLDRLNASRIPAFDDDLEGDAEPGAVSAMEICLVAPEDTLGEVAERLLQHDVSAALVSEHGRLIGILTIHDALAASAARMHPSEARARQWMTAEPITLDADSSSAEAARVMRAYGIHHLPLVDVDRPVGMLHLDDETPAVLPLGLGF